MSEYYFNASHWYVMSVLFWKCDTPPSGLFAQRTTTSHLPGGSTEEAQSAIGVEVATALVKYLNAGATAGSVNFPEIDLRMPGEGTKMVRVLNVHRNVPGVLKVRGVWVSRIVARSCGALA